jgi:hypothetical protein
MISCGSKGAGRLGKKEEQDGLALANGYAYFDGSTGNSRRRCRLVHFWKMDPRDRLGGRITASDERGHIQGRQEKRGFPSLKATTWIARKNTIRTDATVVMSPVPTRGRAAIVFNTI